MTKYRELRKEFVKPSFREYIKEKCGVKCVNCGSENNIEYHHIVPLKNGGTNNIGNIVCLCKQCHYKAHDKEGLKTKNGGRPQKISYEEAEPILHRYFNLEIGTKKAKELLGLPDKTKSTWSRITKEYKERHNINHKFRNNIDIKEHHKRRVEEIIKSQQLRR